MCVSLVRAQTRFPASRARRRAASRSGRAPPRGRCDAPPRPTVGRTRRARRREPCLQATACSPARPPTPRARTPGRSRPDRSLEIAFNPSSTSLPSAANSALRWSMVGCAMACSTRSGTLVGPGICRNGRPRIRANRNLNRAKDGLRPQQCDNSRLPCRVSRCCLVRPVPQADVRRVDLDSPAGGPRAGDSGRGPIRRRVTGAVLHRRQRLPDPASRRCPAADRARISCEPCRIFVTSSAAR